MTRRRVALIALAALLAAGLAVCVAFALHDRERRRLERDLERDLAAERARMPERRPALRDPRADGELLAGLEEALLRLPEAKKASIATPGGGATLTFDDDDEPSPEDAESAAVELAGVRRALSLESADAVAAMLRPRSSALEKATERARRLLDATAAVELSKKHGLEAAKLALDSLQLAHDAARAAPRLVLHEADLAGAEKQLLVAIPLLDDSGTAEILTELDRLEAGLPRLHDRIRRRRLCAGVALRALPRGEDVPFDEELGVPAEEDQLSFGTSPLRERPDVVWPRLNAASELAENATGGTFDLALERVLDAPGVPEPIARGAERLVFDELAVECGELAHLRAGRIVLRVQSFMRSHGRAPSSLEEALGRPPGRGERDPANGELLEVDLEAGRVRVRSEKFDTGTGE